MENIIVEVKNRTGLNQRQIADAIKESPEMVSAWKRGTMPSGWVTLKLLKLAHITTDEAMEIFKNKEKGYAEIWLMIGIALMSVLYFVGITQTAPIQALAQTWSAVHCILCKIKKRIQKLFSPSYVMAYS